ncbi:MAG: purine-nucleoside phosphorylase [Planctomycetia bacterium]|nr:purine-nucleoside phosphorylase [Planctomycetia bacterium]
MYDQIQQAAAAIRNKWNGQPRVGIILGTGLGGLVEEIEAQATIPYCDIPHFSVSSAPTHAGRLVCGRLSGQTVVAMEGRVHYYEGFSAQQITMPVRVMRALGCEILIASNASGGLNPQFRKGDIMLIEDHIGLLMDNPLRGPNDERLGPRFPDMCRPYDPELIQKARWIALEEKIACQQGVFVAVPGPNLETRAEYRFLRQMGADAVGMSTVPEVIVAAHGGMRTVGLSIITDMCLPDALEPINLPDIIATANAAEKKLRVIVKRLLRELGANG